MRTGVGLTAGAMATLAQCSQAIAQLINDPKGSWDLRRMIKQHGGPVNGWILAALVAAALASAAMNVYQAKHHITQIVMPRALGPIGVFPRYADSCGSPGAICYLKI